MTLIGITKELDMKYIPIIKQNQYIEKIIHLEKEIQKNLNKNKNQKRNKIERIEQKSEKIL